MLVSALHKLFTYLDTYPVTYSPGNHMGICVGVFYQVVMAWHKSTSHSTSSLISTEIATVTDTMSRYINSHPGQLGLLASMGR